MFEGAVSSESAHLLAFASACHVFVLVSYLAEVIKYDQRKGLFDSQFQASQPMTVGKSQRHELEAAGSLISPSEERNECLNA